MNFHFLQILICLTFFLSSCVSQNEHDEVLKKLEFVKSELEKCQYGDEKMQAQALRLLSMGQLDSAYSVANNLLNTHPSSQYVDEMHTLIAKITADKKENAKRLERERLAKEKARKDAELIAKRNFTGMWEVSNYVDQFGQNTSQVYVSTKKRLTGRFSNSATENSPLGIGFIIDGPNNIAIKLYEYDGNNYVKAYSYTSYTVLIQDKDGNKYEVDAGNNSDRIGFGTIDSQTVHRILMKGGEVKFHMNEDRTPITKYNFVIDNADYYENAIRILNEKRK